MKLFSSVLAFCFVILISCSNTNTTNKKNKSKKKEKTYFVLVETPYGNMKLKLYNETPLHRDNFIKLVNEEFYDSLLFHRVMNEFMIQGGDPESKGAKQDARLGNGGPGYKINAEFIPTAYHKKGALAAARESDQVNPDKKSSGSQFYIVHGKTFSADDLKNMEKKINFPKKQELVYSYIEKPENAALKQKLDSLQRIRATMELNNTYQNISLKLEKEYNNLDLFKYTPEQVEAYTTIGGTPHLDQNYTVFGEVIEGLNVIDSIAIQKADRNNRPLENIIMKMKVVRK